jgi:hypothetical protein
VTVRTAIVAMLLLTGCNDPVKNIEKYLGPGSLCRINSNLGYLCQRGDERLICEEHEGKVLCGVIINQVEDSNATNR